MYFLIWMILHQAFLSIHIQYDIGIGLASDGDESRVQSMYRNVMSLDRSAVNSHR